MCLSVQFQNTQVKYEVMVPAQPGSIVCNLTTPEIPHQLSCNSGKARGSRSAKEARRRDVRPECGEWPECCLRRWGLALPPAGLSACTHTHPTSQAVPPGTPQEITHLSQGAAGYGCLGGKGPGLRHWKVGTESSRKLPVNSCAVNSHTHRNQQLSQPETQRISTNKT